jgi:hypothetical protein
MFVKGFLQHHSLRNSIAYNQPKKEIARNKIRLKILFAVREIRFGVKW